MNDKKYRIALFGSAFNPPTLGHVDAILQLDGKFDKLLLVPSYNHPLKKKILSFYHRVKMVQYLKTYLFAQLKSDLDIELIEEKMALKGEKNYTFNVLLALQFKYPDAKITFVRGPDNASPSMWHRFYRYEDIENKWSIINVEQRVNIRSAMVRSLLAGKRLNQNDIELQLYKFLIPAVKTYIIENKLYFN